jgi:hypothetical protein
LNDPELLPDPLPAGQSPCQGDCDHNQLVSVDELIVGVRIALGDSQFTCSALGSGGTDLRIDDLVASVSNALHECRQPAQVDTQVSTSRVPTTFWQGLRPSEKKTG